MNNRRVESKKSIDYCSEREIDFLLPCPSLSEKQVETYFCKRVASSGIAKALKLVCLGFSGVPDRLVLIRPSRVAFVELKATNGRLSKLQEKVIAWLRDWGFDVAVLNSKAAVDHWVAERAL